jgi:hypothetical protein
MDHASKPQLLENDPAAEFIHVAPDTLTTWRCTKKVSIPYLKVGRKVLYDVADLRAWLESRKVTK